MPEAFSLVMRIYDSSTGGHQGVQTKTVVKELLLVRKKKTCVFTCERERRSILLRSVRSEAVYRSEAMIPLSYLSLFLSLGSPTQPQATSLVVAGHQENKMSNKHETND